MRPSDYFLLWMGLEALVFSKGEGVSGPGLGLGLGLGLGAVLLPLGPAVSEALVSTNCKQGRAGDPLKRPDLWGGNRIM